MTYVGLRVQLHGLEQSIKAPEEIRQEVETLLRNYFDPDFVNDIEVVLEESA